MLKYACPYESDGASYVAAIEASSSAEAVEKMMRLPWGPNGHPSGNPTPWYPWLQIIGTPTWLNPICSRLVGHNE